jgi:hypothetical protein
MTQPTTSGSGTELDTPLATQPKKPEKASLLDDFMDIFYTPSSVFARRANGDFWIPMLIVTVLLGAIFMANRDLLDPIMEAEVARATAKSASQGATAEQIAAGRKVVGMLASISAFVGPPIGMIILGLIIWIVGKFFDAKQTLNAAIVVATFSSVPHIVEGIATRIQGLFIDPASINSRYSFSLGLGRLLDPDTASPVLLAFAGRVELFTLWVTVLIAIGIAVTGKVSRGRAAIAAAVVWLIGVLPSLAAALRA